MLILLKRIIEHGGYPPHFSGNFLWAKSSYISRNPVNWLTQKADAEFWLLHNNPTFISIHSRRDGGYYDYPFPLNAYSSEVDYNLRSYVDLLKRISQGESFNIYYGIEDNYIDVTKICFERLTTDGMLHIPLSDSVRDRYFSDPLPGTIKHIRIGDVKLQDTNSIHIKFKYVFI